MSLTCPECGAPMEQRYSKKFDRYFWGCAKFPECKGTHSAHPDGRPMGTPANQETKEWRHKAHAAFDLLWNSSRKRMKRQEAYKVLQHVMGMTPGDAHIANFNIQQCQELIEKLSNPSVMQIAMLRLSTEHAQHAHRKHQRRMKSKRKTPEPKQ